MTGTTTGTQTFTQVVSGSSTAAAVTATWSQAGTNVLPATDPTDEWPWAGSTNAMFGNVFTTMVTNGAPVARAVDIVGDGCSVQTSQATLCLNRGTVTVTFSRAVTNPVLLLAGFGGNRRTTSGAS